MIMMADASRARQAFSDAEHSLNLAIKEKETAEADLDDLFSIDGFGAEGEWKKLDGTCLEKDTGECVYCCFPDSLSDFSMTDTPMKSVSSTRQDRNQIRVDRHSVLGKSLFYSSIHARITKFDLRRRFTSWNLAATPGTTEFYSKQVYKNGAKCWNGPERSVVVCRPEPHVFCC
jgi:protein kinase C substrate 80K-H